MTTLSSDTSAPLRGVSLAYLYTRPTSSTWNRGGGPPTPKGEKLRRQLTSTDPELAAPQHFADPIHRLLTSGRPFAQVVEIGYYQRTWTYDDVARVAATLT